MGPMEILYLFLGLSAAQRLVENALAAANYRYWQDGERQRQARTALGISEGDFAKTLAYSEDKYRFARMSNAIVFPITLLFLALGGLGYAERLAQNLAVSMGLGSIGTGLGFFAILGLASFVLGLPLSWFQTFVIEERHGFNRQTPRGFVVDRLKGLALAIILGGALAALLLWIMEVVGSWWWIAAWVTVSGFSLFTAWAYPTILAPMFNKFSKVEDSALSQAILDLAQKVGFRAGGISVMDASKRSAHGNAYFTGVFGDKRIVLFDTLLAALTHTEVVAVLAHELGHFKLHHVRWGLVRSMLMTLLMFYVLSLVLPWPPVYQAFALAGPSNYAALVLFSLWFAPIDLLLSPLSNGISRRNEFAADAFAVQAVGSGSTLASALLKLREKSQSMPLTHPWYSLFYHSHPPLLERLARLR